MKNRSKKKQSSFKNLRVWSKKYWWFLLLLVLIGGYCFYDADSFVAPLSGDAEIRSFGGASQAYNELAVSYEISDNFMDESATKANYDDSYAHQADQKVMKSGSLNLHVEDVRESVDKMEDYVTGVGGFLVDSNINRSDGSYLAYLSLKVPADQFESSMDYLKEMSLYVDYESVNADDVTETYMDLEARLNNLTAEESAYLELLDETGDVGEVLEITEALSNVRYEIESIQNSLDYYDSRIDYSFINLTLTEDESVSNVADKWRPVGTVKEAFGDWLVFLQGAVDTVIYALIYLWPLAFFALLFWLFKRRG